MYPLCGINLRQRNQRVSPLRAGLLQSFCDRPENRPYRNKSVSDNPQANSLH